MNINRYSADLDSERNPHIQEQRNLYILFVFNSYSLTWSAIWLSTVLLGCCEKLYRITIREKNVIGVDEVDQILWNYEYYDIDLETIDQAIFRLSLVDNDVEY